MFDWMSLLLTEIKEKSNTVDVWLNVTLINGNKWKK